MNFMAFSHLQRELRTFAEHPDALLAHFLLTVSTRDLVPCLWLMQDPYLNRVVAAGISPRASGMLLQDVAGYNGGRTPEQSTTAECSAALIHARAVTEVIRSLRTRQPAHV